MRCYIYTSRMALNTCGNIPERGGLFVCPGRTHKSGLPDCTNPALPSSTRSTDADSAATPKHSGRKETSEDSVRKIWPQKKKKEEMIDSVTCGRQRRRRRRQRRRKRRQRTRQGPQARKRRRQACQEGISARPTAGGAPCWSTAKECGGMSSRIIFLPRGRSGARSSTNTTYMLCRRAVLPMTSKEETARSFGSAGEGPRGIAVGVDAK